MLIAQRTFSFNTQAMSAGGARLLTVLNNSVEKMFVEPLGIVSAGPNCVKYVADALIRDADVREDDREDLGIDLAALEELHRRQAQPLERVGHRGEHLLVHTPSIIGSAA